MGNGVCYMCRCQQFSNDPADIGNCKVYNIGDIPWGQCGENDVEPKKECVAGQAPNQVSYGNGDYWVDEKTNCNLCRCDGKGCWTVIVEDLFCDNANNGGNDDDNNDDENDDEDDENENPIDCKCSWGKQTYQADEYWEVVVGGKPMCYTCFPAAPGVCQAQLLGVTGETRGLDECSAEGSAVEDENEEEEQIDEDTCSCDINGQTYQIGDHWEMVIGGQLKCYICFSAAAGLCQITLKGVVGKTPGLDKCSAEYPMDEASEVEDENEEEQQANEPFCPEILPNKWDHQDSGTVYNMELTTSTRCPGPVLCSRWKVYFKTGVDYQNDVISASDVSFADYKPLPVTSKTCVKEAGSKTAAAEVIAQRCQCKEGFYLNRAGTQCVTFDECVANKEVVSGGNRD